jgi:signal transduction histidine kinase
MLVGYDKDWSPPDNKSSANFGNIYSGTYTFKIKAQSPEGVWSEPVSYTFKVLPPWWKTWWMYILYLLAFLILLRLFFRWRQRRIIWERDMLEKKVKHRTAQLNKSFEDLKSTQSQLIQSEKMASLGELTAGIAHEIQNPLNFVNNFSEVSNELFDEMNDELNKGDIEEAKAIAADIKQNLTKINHHGKRAGDIVKGMLQHSQKSTGVKEPTDINALCDEYLRLTYHGLRAKDKTFNAMIKTDFDASLEKINIIPQDIGRVVLNLLNNAFYVVDERKKLNIPGYEPTVTISTSRSLSFGEGRGEVTIKVTDNGNGIPPKVLDKIFQPFFTTKPTGQGTGLGLSLSYDIIKAHGGEIKVETKEGEGSTFLIQLSITQ